MKEKINWTENFEAIHKVMPKAIITLKAFPNKSYVLTICFKCEDEKTSETLTPLFPMEN